MFLINIYHIIISFLFISMSVSDTNVHRNSCTKDQFSCFNGQCIRRTWWCNGINECGDNSDERYCDNTIPVQYSHHGQIRCFTTRGIWFVCNSRRRCYPPEWKCNGYMDCLDGSDEIGCSPDTSTLVPVTTSTLAPITSTLAVLTVKDVEKITGATNARHKLTTWFLGQRKTETTTNKWGHHLHRTVSALYLADQSFFRAGNTTGEEMAYEISLQILSKLTLQKKLTCQDLALYVNAMLATCINPHDFYGHDLVAQLRGCVDRQNYTNPFELIVLCNAQDTMTAQDVQKATNAFRSQHRPCWTDTQALSVLALSCMSSQSKTNVDEGVLNQMVQELKKKQQKNGTIDNLKSTALVIQALFATESYREEFDLEASVKLIIQKQKSDGGYGCFLEAYYILPVLSFKTLIGVNSNHCKFPSNTRAENLKHLQNTSGEHIRVQYSIFVGDEVDVSRTWKVKVLANSTFYEVIEIVRSLDSKHEVQYNVFEGKPYISAVNLLEEDTENDLYWFTYIRIAGETEEYTLVQDSPVDVKVKNNEELILWYKSGDWAAVDHPSDAK